ncbi:hypothetical protein HanXRQr2_Chr08g0340211 [Helianthus annuus]|uniref:Uncharacterized protein n=1 Tax=Helianthus annuus TaxID=4232 RepID=A0A9K3NCS2_HELAN|nr:hypothetical protein HanXRQr2_Chr08g0340211 [Helianthus annuus]KAJ0901720.1 hypothetical protein HanPSC8_Chr08g0328601 [Helianthus annuus]
MISEQSILYLNYVSYEVTCLFSCSWLELSRFFSFPATTLPWSLLPDQPSTNYSISSSFSTSSSVHRHHSHSPSLSSSYHHSSTPYLSYPQPSTHSYSYTTPSQTSNMEHSYQ